MNKAIPVILRYLEEFDEETPTALINVYRDRESVEEGVVDLVYEGISYLLANGLVTLGEMRANSYGASEMKMLHGVSEEILDAWKKGTVWDDVQGIWVWNRPKDFRPYVVLGDTRKWRTATREEIAEELRRVEETPDDDGFSK